MRSNPEGWDRTVQTAITMTSVLPRHPAAYSGARAVSEAMTEHPQVSSVQKAAIYGAKKGGEIGLAQTRQACGARIPNRLPAAIGYVYHSDSPEDAASLPALPV